jgi:hypothetical protein
MCASCGCGKPNDQHGDNRHITLDQVKQAAKASEISPKEVAQNLMDSVNQDSAGASQSSAAGGSD